MCQKFQLILQPSDVFNSSSTSISISSQLHQMIRNKIFELKVIDFENRSYHVWCYKCVHGYHEWVKSIHVQINRLYTQVPSPTVFVIKKAQRSGIWQIKPLASLEQKPLSVKSNNSGFWTFWTLNVDKL